MNHVLDEQIKTLLPILSLAEIEKKTDFLPRLFDNMLAGQATSKDMRCMADLFHEHHVAVLRISEEQMQQVPRIDWSDMPNTACWSRYGSFDKPIFSCPIAGQLNSQGAVLISSAQGDSCDISHFDAYLTPLHYHHQVVHISMVLRGAGVFLIAGDIQNKKYLLKIPVKRGDLALIPANVIHTFFANPGGLEVLSFTDKLIPADSPDFLVLADKNELKSRTLIDYSDFLDRNYMASRERMVVI